MGSLIVCASHIKPCQRQVRYDPEKNTYIIYLFNCKYEAVVRPRQLEIFTKGPTRDHLRVGYSAWLRGCLDLSLGVIPFFDDWTREPLRHIFCTRGMPSPEPLSASDPWFGRVGVTTPNTSISKLLSLVISKIAVEPRPPSSPGTFPSPLLVAFPSLSFIGLKYLRTEVCEGHGLPQEENNWTLAKPRTSLMFLWARVVRIRWAKLHCKLYLHITAVRKL